MFAVNARLLRAPLFGAELRGIVDLPRPGLGAVAGISHRLGKHPTSKPRLVCAGAGALQVQLWQGSKILSNQSLTGRRVGSHWP